MTKHQSILNEDCMKTIMFVIALITLALSACGGVTPITSVPIRTPDSPSTSFVNVTPSQPPTFNISPNLESTTFFKNFIMNSDTAGKLQFAVDYIYNGDNGAIIFSAGCLKNGQETCVITGINPFGLNRQENGQLDVSLGLYGPDKITTDKIFVAIYHQNGIGLIYYQTFDYVKQWTVVLPTPTMVK
jgi:hypothetical protein